MTKSICYQIKNYGYVILNKIAYIRTYKESDKRLVEYHYMRDDEYERNPTPYCLKVTLDGGTEYVFRYTSEKERDEVLNSLVTAINE